MVINRRLVVARLARVVTDATRRGMIKSVGAIPMLAMLSDEYKGELPRPLNITLPPPSFIGIMQIADSARKLHIATGARNAEATRNHLRELAHLMRRIDLECQPLEAYARLREVMVGAGFASFLGLRDVDWLPQNRDYRSALFHVGVINELLGELTAVRYYVEAFTYPEPFVEKSSKLNFASIVQAILDKPLTYPNLYEHIARQALMAACETRSCDQSLSGRIYLNFAEELTVRLLALEKIENHSKPS